MKKIIIALTIACSSFAAAYAQNLLNKIPSDASVVLKYSGENFSKNLPLKKVDSYNFVKQNLFKTLKIDTLTSLQNLGIDFEKDTYQYFSIGDSATNFVTLLNLQSVPQFLQLVQANYQAEMKPEKRNGYEFLSISNDTYLGWNTQHAVLVVSSDKNKKNYYDYPSTAADTTTTLPVEHGELFDKQAEEKIEEIQEAPVQPKAKQPIAKKKKPGAVARKGTKGKKSPAKKKPVAPPEEVIEEMVVTDAPAYYEDTVETAKREAWYKEQEKITAAKQRQVADSIINSSFNSSFASIENDGSYKKLIEPAAHVSVWLNYENLLKQYSSVFFKGFSPRRFDEFEPKYIDQTDNKGFRSGMNVYFEKDKMRIDQKAWSPDPEMANLGKDLYNSKQNPALASYVNPGNIGFLSASINSEAMANYYYKLIKQYMSSYPYVREYADLVDVYIDLVEIIIDEKAIAELMPGNMLFVMHDMTTKQVTYTDYVYDENDFKSKEVKKTKQELAPNFTFVMETKKEGFMKKVANLPVKYAKKQKFDYQEKGGYYELAFDKDKYPISSLFFIVKDGKVVVTTNKPSIDITLNNIAGYTPDADSKNAILNNNYALKLNSKKLVQQLQGEMSTSLNKKISQYMEENLGDVKMESSLKDGMIQASTTMAVTGSHTNSLEFFFTMIDSINDIMEKDKLEREKKVD